jgi:hypothetical protein
MQLKSLSDKMKMPTLRALLNEQAAKIAFMEIEITSLKATVISMQIPTHDQIKAVNDAIDYANTIRSALRDEFNLFIAKKTPDKL